MNEQEKLEVESYEHNLKLHYEAKRKELDILLSNSIPNQLANMKTILWINFLLIGLMLQFIKNFPLFDTIIGFFLLSVLAIFTVLIAMLSNRTKSYGVNDNLEMMSTYKTDQWTKSQALIDMLHTLQKAILDNRRVLINRGKLMYIATWFTLFSIFFIIISFIFKHLSL
ncbi:conserved hypothetical protein [Aliarcobacter butzleri JV22]|uniref:hypothetical protein n=1 Tax=Aliarcobacter butzleri TaxID=28197 RepID=UPI0001F14CBD|nr:hypothetical protein [Aliarcobacter butzleri]EFU69155.1 conserved hypothetical protein [Aliarcobacter butzleri JV22]